MRLLEDVVAETHDEPLTRCERTRHPDDLGDPSGLDLHLVREVEVEEHVVAAPCPHPAVAEQVDELPRMLLSGDERTSGTPTRCKSCNG